MAEQRRREFREGDDILQMLDRETQEQLRLARQDRQEFEARNGERYTVRERVEARMPGATINNNWRPATITRVGRLVVRNNSSGREMDRQESGVRDPATQETGETANLRIRSPVEIQMLRNRWVPGILISKNYSVQFDGADNIVPLTSEDIRRPQAQAPQQVEAQAPQAPQAQAPVEAPAPAVAVAQIVNDGNYSQGEQVELEKPINSNNWIPGSILGFKSFGVTSGPEPASLKEPGYVRNPTTRSTIYTDIPINSEVEIRRGRDTWYPGRLIFKKYDVSFIDPRTGRLVINQSFQHFNIRRPQGQAPQAVAPAPQAEAPAVAVAPQRQLRQPTAVEPNPPYRSGENVECLADDPNTGRRVWNSAVIRDRDLNILSAFVIANEQTGRVVERTRTDVYSTTGRSAANYVRIGDTVMYDEPRVRGIVMDKIYNVSYTNTRGQRLLTEKRTGEIRRPQEQAPPPQPTEALAFEIHNAFDSFKFDKFMDIVRKNSNFKNRDAPLKPLIDNVNANPNLSPEKKTELSEKIERIFTTLRQYSNYDRNINNIMDCIQYVLMQPQDFINIYIDTFITDCLKAYSTGRGDSCIKGMYERVYFAFRDTVSTICLDQIQGTGAAPLCKPEYIEIFNCFYEDMPTEMLNDYAQQWFQERGEEAGNFSEENRIEDFVGFVRSKVNNVARFRQAERSVRRYAATNINVLFGGRRKRSDGYKKVRKTVRRRKNITMKKRGNNIRNNSRNKQRNKKTRKH
jgi:hypothetical protein